MRLCNWMYRAIRKILVEISNFSTQKITQILFYVHNISCDTGFTSTGIPILHIDQSAKIRFGKNFKIHNFIRSNPIGRSEKCLFVVRKYAELTIGDNTGMSGTTIVCQKKITIDSNVKIGGNVCIYDTDFHALDPELRKIPDLDRANTTKKEVHIHDNVFIGAHCTILKGVTIGENSIIGACSVVTKDVPANEVWAGNPAQFIRIVNDSK